MTENFIIEESSADIHLFTIKDEITMDHHDTFTLKFTPELPQLLEEKKREFIRDTAIVNIINNTCKGSPRNMLIATLLAARNEYSAIVHSLIIIHV